MTPQEIQILLEIVTIIIGFYLAFFKSYLQERGKIAATKKDIDKITEKVESVKSEIGILTHKKITLATEKQNTLIDFNNKHSAWLNYIMHVSFVGNNETADGYNMKVNDKLDDLFYDCVVSEAKLDVFFNSDDALIEKKDDLKFKTTELSGILSGYLIKIGVEAKCVAIYEKSDQNDSLEKIGEHNAKLIEISKECQQKKLEKYKEILPLKLKFVELISARIYDFEKK